MVALTGITIIRTKNTGCVINYCEAVNNASDLPWRTSWSSEILETLATYHPSTTYIVLKDQNNTFIQNIRSSKLAKLDRLDLYNLRRVAMFSFLVAASSLVLPAVSLLVVPFQDAPQDANIRGSHHLTVDLKCSQCPFPVSKDMDKLDWDHGFDSALVVHPRFFFQSWLTF